VRKWTWLLVLCGVCAVVAVFALRASISYAPALEDGLEGPAPQAVFDPYIQRIFIGQEDEHGSYRVKELEKGNFPREPLQLAVHTDKAYVNINISTNQPLEVVERFFAQVDIIGDVTYSTAAKEVSPGHYQLSLHFSDLPREFALRIGNLPKMTLKRMEPLQVYAEPAKGDEPVLLLLPGDTGSLYVLEGLNDIILRFSEPMVPPEEVGRSVPELAGTWRDEQTLQLNIQSFHDKPLNLALLYSRSGNYLPPGLEMVEVLQLPEREWVEFPSGARAGFSRYDSFYDWLIFSPDGDKYVGLIDRGGSQGDGSGRVFAILLEQQGQQPVLVDPSFYSDLLGHGAPVQWLDNERFAYASFFGAFVWEAATGVNRELFDNRFQSSQQAIRELAVDRWGRKLYLLVHHRETQDGQDVYRVAKWTYDADTLVRTHTEEYAETFLQDTYQLLDLPVLVRENGTYYTKAIAANKRVRTTFVSRKGRSWTVDGQVVWADHRGHALVVQHPYNDAAGKPLYSWWEIGSRPQRLPPVNGTVQPFGPFVVSDDGKRTYKLDSERKRWDELPLVAADVHLPIQEERALYRRDR
jgi:hypothetical protein